MNDTAVAEKEVHVNTVGGRKAWVFKKLENGKRSENFYVKGNVPGEVEGALTLLAGEAAGLALVLVFMTAGVLVVVFWFAARKAER